MYEWKAVLEFYAAHLRQIELGRVKWGEEIVGLESILHTHVKRPAFTSKSFASNGKSEYTGTGGKRDNLVWFCTAYQRNKCTEKGNHIASINGMSRFVQHICAACWKNGGEKLGHPECSPACPLRI